MGSIESCWLCLKSLLYARTLPTFRKTSPSPSSGWKSNMPRGKKVVIHRKRKERCFGEEPLADGAWLVFIS
jgi:hypothetical protein